jgi:hypothetical protein
MKDALLQAGERLAEAIRAELSAQGNCAWPSRMGGWWWPVDRPLHGMLNWVRPAWRRLGPWKRRPARLPGMWCGGLRMI